MFFRLNIDFPVKWSTTLRSIGAFAITNACLPSGLPLSPLLLWWWSLFTHQTIIDTVVMITCYTHTSFIVGVWSKEKINQQELSVVSVWKCWLPLASFIDYELISGWWCEVKVPSCYTTKHHQSRTGAVNFSLTRLLSGVTFVLCEHSIIEKSSWTQQDAPRFFSICLFISLLTNILVYSSV